MSTIQFIPNNPETILTDTIATYSQQFGEPLHPADPERIMIDVMAYRESVLRGEMENLMRQNFVQYAAAPHLDSWGALFGVARLDGETDDDYRLRILNSPHSAIGTENAYRLAILSLETIADITIERKSDDPTLPPGVIRLTPLIENVVDGVVYGVPHTPETVEAINAIIYADTFGIIGPIFIYRHAQAAPIDGTVIVRAILGYNVEQVRRNVDRKIAEYFGAISQKFTSTFGVFDLERAIQSAEGVLTVVNMDFPNIPVLRLGQYYTRGITTITAQ